MIYEEAERGSKLFQIGKRGGGGGGPKLFIEKFRWGAVVWGTL